MFILNALYFTRDGAKRNYAKQIGTLVHKARAQLGEVPIVFGECGTPMDMKFVSLTPAVTSRHTPSSGMLTNSNEEAFRTGNWDWHERMMDSLISALESSLVGFKYVTCPSCQRGGDDG